MDSRSRPALCHFASLRLAFRQLLLFAVAGLITTSAQAVTAEGIFDRFFGPVPAISIKASDMKRVLRRLVQTPQSSLLKPDLIQPQEFEGCLGQYSQFYQDGVLDINLVVGYHDWPQVRRNLDQDSVDMIYDSLTRSCSEDLSNVCGFKEVDKVHRNQVVLEKQFLGLDTRAAALGLTEDHPLLKRILTIRVRLTHSSYSRYERDLLVDGKPIPEQLETSQIAEDTFFGGIGEPGHSIATCDVCGYLGHARNGGGPDFRPVPLEWRDETGDTDYSYYLKTRTNFRRLLRALKSSQHPTKQLISIMGCNSQGNFHDRSRRACLIQGERGCKALTLKDFENKFGFILTNKLSWPTNSANYLGIFFDGLVNMKCRSAWDENFRTMDDIPETPEAYRIHGNAF